MILKLRWSVKDSSLSLSVKKIPIVYMSPQLRKSLFERPSCSSNRTRTRFLIFLLPANCMALWTNHKGSGPAPGCLVYCSHSIYRAKQFLKIRSSEWSSHFALFRNSVEIMNLSFSRDLFSASHSFERERRALFWMELHTKLFTSFEKGFQNIK